MLIHAQSDTARTIDIYNADVLIGTKRNGISIQKLVGKVALHHEGAIMFCDSALLYDQTNQLDAFGRIHIKQGDTLSIFGDQLKYNGNTKIADMQGRVRLIDAQLTLNTSQLIYDRKAGMAYYPDSAMSVTRTEKLSSKKGYYYVDKRMFAFKGDVVIRHPDYTLFSDTLLQNTVTDISYFIGPSTIESEESFIYCENGWYDKRNDRCQFNKNAYIISDQNILRGDSIYYERKKGYGKAIGNVSVEDTVEQTTITGQFAESFRNIEKYYITDSAMLMKVFDGDTLFMHADTILAITDTLKKKVINGFYHVRFFKKDMQGLCDSLSYTQRDSLLRMYGLPVLWNNQHQITAEYVDVCIGKEEVYYMNIHHMARLISQEDSLKYNQLGGEDMKAYFTGNELTRLEVYDNSKSFYYQKEDGGDYVGLNEVDCDDMVIFMEKQEVVKIVFKTKPIGILHPLQNINPVDFRLEGFSWQQERRPKIWSDIFTWY